MKEPHDFIREAENNQSQDATVPEHTENPPSKKIRLDTTEADSHFEGDTAMVPVSDEPDKKTAESGVCVVCLGVLQEFCDRAHATKVCSSQTFE